MREAVIRDWFEERLITPQGLRGQVLEGPEGPDEMRRVVLEDLVDAHLVRGESRRQATWYELAHDRLIEPVRRDNAAWRTHHQTPFERAAALWEQEGKSDRLLLLGEDLAAAEDDPAVRAGVLNARQRIFLETSRRADEQARREARTAAMLRRSARRLWIAVALVTLLAAATGVFLVRSRDAEDQAKGQETAAKMIFGIQENLGVDRPLAIGLAESYAQEFGSDGLSEQAQKMLYLAAESPVSLVLRGLPGGTRSGTESLDGTAVVAAGAHDVLVWGRSDGKRRAHLSLRDDESVNAVDISEDGRTVVAGLDDGTLLVWPVAGPERASLEAGGEAHRERRLLPRRAAPRLRRRTRSGAGVGR